MEKLNSDTNSQSHQLNWKVFTIQDFKNLNESLNKDNLCSSDVNTANLFLQQKYYDINCAVKEGYLFRYYSGSKNRFGYGFPLELKNCNKGLNWALCQIIADAKENSREVNFCFCTQEQKNLIDKTLLENFSDKKFYWDTDRGDSDYIYNCQELVNLSGSKLGKKKNHINQFNRAYGEGLSFEFYLPQELNEQQKQAILEIEDKWIEGNPEKNISDNQKHENTYPVEMERDAIKLALENPEVFNIRAGILYYKKEPIAFTMGSATSPKCFDVHFEKTFGEYARSGAFTVINRLFSQANVDFEFINREEDINLEGLRKAKLSYKPLIILDKYFGKMQ